MGRVHPCGVLKSKRDAAQKNIYHIIVASAAPLNEITSPSSWPFRKVSGRATHFSSRHWQERKTGATTIPIVVLTRLIGCIQPGSSSDYPFASRKMQCKNTVRPCRRLLVTWSSRCLARDDLSYSRQNRIEGYTNQPEGLATGVMEMGKSVRPGAQTLHGDEHRCYMDRISLGLCTGIWLSETG